MEISKTLDSVIIAGDTIALDFYDQCEKLINKLLGLGFRVVYKGSNRHPGANINKLKCRFSGVDGFIWYDEPILSVSELKRSVTLIEVGVSSMAYSYPVICKKPSILLYLHTESRDNILNNDIFYHELLHIRICRDEIDSLDEILNRLREDEQYKTMYRESILQYCRWDLYNYGCSSQYIAEWIVKWYESRKILKRSF